MLFHDLVTKTVFFFFLLGLADLSSSSDDLHFSHVCFVKDEVSIFVFSVSECVAWSVSKRLGQHDINFVTQLLALRKHFLTTPCMQAQAYLMRSKIPLCMLSLDSEFSFFP